MITWTIKELAAACGGAVVGVDPDAEVGSIVIDSRAATAGSVFVALVGEHTDGHRFVEDAHGRGAVASIVRDSYEGTGPLVRVADPLRALAAIGAAARARLAASCVAITGSSGKTGTKDLTAAAIASTKRVVSSPASFNNEIGVPLSVLAADASTEVLVLEVGSRGPGHIASLVPVLQPDVAVVTNVGPAHLGMFGSLDVTTAAKGELVEAASEVAVLNADDVRVRSMAERAHGRVVLFGTSRDADVRAADVVLDDRARARFTVLAGTERAEVALQMPGEHAVSNALAALAAALAIEVPLEPAARALASCPPGRWRMEITDAGARTIINDAYNANPESMAAALKTLRTIAQGRPTCAVLGEMAELGASSAQAHDTIGRLVVRLGIGTLIVVGDEARAIHEAAKLEGMFGGESHLVADAGEAVALAHDIVPSDAVVLVKASRAAGLERVAAALVEAG